MFRPLLSPRGEISKRPIAPRKRLIYRDRKRKKRFPNPMAGVVRSTEGRGGGLIGIPFLLLGDSEGKRRVDLEASPSTRV